MTISKVIIRVDLRRVLLNRQIENTESEISALISKLNLSKDVTLKEIIKERDMLNENAGLLNEMQMQRMIELNKLADLKEELIVQGKKLSEMVGQSRFSISMIWSSLAQTASMIQSIASRAGVEWADQLAQAMSVVSNIIAIAFASAAVWAGTGPAGVIMATIQVANASIAMALQGQLSAQQAGISMNQRLNAEIDIGDMPV